MYVWIFILCRLWQVCEQCPVKRSTSWARTLYNTSLTTNSNHHIDAQLEKLLWSQKCLVQQWCFLIKYYRSRLGSDFHSTRQSLKPSAWRICIMLGRGSPRTSRNDTSCFCWIAWQKAWGFGEVTDIVLVANNTSSSVGIRYVNQQTKSNASTHFLFLLLILT